MHRPGNPRLLSALILLTTLLLPFIVCNDNKNPGLHCYDDDQCHGFNLKDDKMYLVGLAVNETDDIRMYQNGENIACLPGSTTDGIHGALCAWVWDTDNTTTGVKIRPATKTLQDHCKYCGSAPLDQSANILATGRLTIGWSWNPQGCDGRCNEWGGSTYGPGDLVASAHA